MIIFSARSIPCKRPSCESLLMKDNDTVLMCDIFKVLQRHCFFNVGVMTVAIFKFMKVSSVRRSIICCLLQQFCQLIFKGFRTHSSGVCTSDSSAHTHTHTHTLSLSLSLSLSLPLCKLLMMRTMKVLTVMRGRKM